MMKHYHHTKHHQHPEHHKHRGPASKHLRIKIILGAAVLILLQGLILAANAKSQSPIFGLKVRGESVHGLDKNQLANLIADKLAAPLKLAYEDKQFEIYPSEAGVNVDIDQFWNNLNKIGRSGNFLSRMIEQDIAIFGLKNMPIEATVSRTLLTVKILEIKGTVNQPALPPTPDFVGDLNHILPAKDGVGVKENELAALVSNNIANPPKNPLAIPAQAIISSHKNDDVRQFAKMAEDLTKKPISIISGGITFTLAPEDIRSLLTLVEKLDPKDPSKTILSLRLDDVKLNRKLDGFAVEVEEKTRAEFNDHDSRIAIYTQFFFQYKAQNYNTGGRGG